MKLGEGALLSWERFDSFLNMHFGRLQAPQMVLPELDALTLDIYKGSLKYASKFQILLTRLGTSPSVVMVLYYFQKGLPHSMSNAMFVKFATVDFEVPIQSYVDALSALLDRVWSAGTGKGSGFGDCWGADGFG